MADQRFFSLAGPFRLGQLAEMTGSVLFEASASGKTVSDVAPLESATPDHVGFLDNKKYLDAFRTTKAGACFVRPELAELAPKGTVCLTHKNPYKAYAIAAQAFYPERPLAAGIAKTAVIDPTARLGTGCQVEDGAIIGAHVKIGQRCRIQSHAVIRDHVEIGDDCDIGPHTYVTHAVLGSKVRLHPGAIIGRPGFGFAIDPAGYINVPQLGRVLIESDVEVGANTTIDRGAGPDTVIGHGTRIDNLVQIGHNVKIGKHCIIVAHVGISGSTQLGDYVVVGGQVGIAGHLKIASGVKIAAQSGVMRDIPDAGEYMGTPAIPFKQSMRQIATLAKIAGKKGSSEE